MNEQESTHARRRSRAEADELVGEYEASGLSRREFCKQHGFSLNTLNRYCARRRARTERAGVDRLVEVEIRGAAAMSENSARGLCLHIAAGRRIEIHRGFDPSTLQQLLQVLERV